MKVSHITGGAAFPRPYSASLSSPVSAQEGMSLRDYFAGHVACGLVSNPVFIKQQAADGPDQVEANVARISYLMADAMLAEREKTRSGNRGG